MKALPALRRAADGLINLSAAIGAIALIVEMGVILADVIGRALGAPLRGGQDVSTMTMIVVVFGAMALCDRMGGHIAVDLLERWFPRRLNRLIDIFAAALGAVIFALIVWAVLDAAAISRLLNLSTNIINLPKAWFQWILAGFAGIAALGMALRAVELAVSGRDVRADGAPAA